MTDPARSLHDQLFDIRRSVRYHRRRQKFFEWSHDMLLWMTALLGTSTASSLFGGWGLIEVAAALTAVASVSNLVFAPARKARLHSDLARRFIDLERLAISPDAENRVSEIKAKRLVIEEDEPPIYRVLDTLCYNEVMRSLGYKDDELIPVPKHVEVTAHWTDLLFSTLKRPGA